MLTRGFTLIEILITLVILVFGLLGIAGLMAKGQRASFEAFQRQQALELANTMAENIFANRLQATTYIAGAPIATPVGNGLTYGDLLTGGVTDCGTLTCTPPQLAAYDLAMWDGLLNGYSERQTGTANRVGGIVGAIGCVDEIVNTSGTCPAPPATTTPFTRSIRISVAWQGNDDTAVPTNSACGANRYTSETRRRVVNLNLMVLQPCP